MYYFVFVSHYGSLNIDQLHCHEYSGSVAIQIASWGNIEIQCLEQRAEEYTIRVTRACVRSVFGISMRTAGDQETSGPYDDAAAAAVKMVKSTRELAGTIRGMRVQRTSSVFHPRSSVVAAKIPQFRHESVRRQNRIFAAAESETAI